MNVYILRTQEREAFGSAWLDIVVWIESRSLLAQRSHHLFVSHGHIVGFFFRMTAKTISEFFIKIKMAVCMFVEPEHSTHPVTKWWVSSIVFSVRDRDHKHKMCSIQCFMCLFVCFCMLFLVLWKWSAEFTEQARRWEGEMSVWSFSTIHIWDGWYVWTLFIHNFAS